ncbi:MAG: putative glycoside hydrolase [Candidatus Nanoarchaeia archaeon]|jgi:hypothetical protein
MRFNYFFLTLLIIFVSGCADDNNFNLQSNKIDNNLNEFPKIASWLAKKDEIIASEKPFSLIMSGWFTETEAANIKLINPNAKLLAGLSTNWVWNNSEWMAFLLAITNYNKENPVNITEDMYLHNLDGSRCAFGWQSNEWGYEEIYSMDPRNEKWVELIVTFYGNVLSQPQHDGIIVDMVVKEQFWCPDAISAIEWQSATKNIMQKISDLNTENKMIIFNAGRNLSDIEIFSSYFDGYLMENFMGEQLNSTFDEGLNAAKNDYIIIYGVDTDDSGIKDLNKMRLGLTLSMLNNNTYFAYDFGPRNHGQAWWFTEYDANLGKPLSDYYKKDEAYFREFENGIIVSSPYSNVTVNFEQNYTDVTTKMQNSSFIVNKGDGRIFIKI